MKSKHAPTLNELCQMQESAVYALRKSTLAEAERIIVQQEEEIERLNRIIGRTNIRERSTKP
jgi:hypothetical protein